MIPAGLHTGYIEEKTSEASEKVRGNASPTDEVHVSRDLISDCKDPGNYATEVPSLTSVELNLDTSATTVGHEDET